MSYIIGIILSFLLIDVLICPIVGLCHLVFYIIGTVGTAKGSALRVPSCSSELKQMAQARPSSLRPR